MVALGASPGVAAASARTTSSGCGQDLAAGVTCRFSLLSKPYPAYQMTVPQGMSSLPVVLIGGAGASGDDGGSAAGAPWWLPTCR
ncbi:MAG: hypothetical protein ACR2NR_00835 [Solirubrobacteraceae bacterium]